MNEQARRRLALEFTASGSEYFRIWIVNLLLIAITVGFYMPFAKARRLQYFYANTRIDGQALSFHGSPWKLLRGYVLMLGLFGGYSLSGHFSAWAALGVFLLLALLWPALWRSSLRFRLHNTSWRGLRFGFEGSPGEAYRALLPLFLPGLIFVAANAWYVNGIDPTDADAMKAAFEAQAPWVLLGFVLLAGLFPLCLCLMKRYQHAGYRYAGQRGEFTAAARTFYLLAVKAVGLSLLAMAALAGAGALAFYLLGGAMAMGGGMAAAVASGLAFVALYVLLLSLLGAYFTARLQNLVWNATRSQSLQFSSTLRAWQLARLTMKNILLTLLTLGLYRPFAVVHTMALRLAAVQVDLEGDIDTWHAGEALGTEATAGEMAGDFFGIDVGL